MNNSVLNNQQVFNNALIGMRAQNYKKSAEESGRCVYRGENNLKCGIGFSIPDEVYDPKMDETTYGISDLISKGFFPELNMLFKDCSPNMLSYVQQCHDDAMPLEIVGQFSQYKDRFEEGMKWIAKIFNLIYMPPEQAQAKPIN